MRLTIKPTALTVKHMRRDDWYSPRKLSKKKYLYNLRDCDEGLYMEVVYGLDTPNQMQRYQAHRGWNGWFGVCLPIKTAALHGLHRKSLEHYAAVMLQEQKRHFVF